MSATTAAKKAEKKAVQKKSVHPPTAVMVKSALASLNDKNGSSLPVIKKYIAANYEGIDVARQAPFIRRYLRKAVAEGVVSQNKRTFWTGGKKDAKPKKPAAKKVKTPKKIVPKKKPAAAKKSPKKAAKLASAKKSPKIARKAAAAKSPAKKPVAKKLTKRASPKKAAPKK